jgi:predicted GIY-YIG superfamily endonuclease
MGKFYTYLITAKIKGILWYYVGKTFDLKDRWAHHKWAGTTEDEKYPSYLHRKMYKYGFELFKMTVIGEFNSEKEAFNSEIQWIARLKANKTRYPKGQGMNLTDGGEGASGAIVTAETRLKLSIANKGQKRSPEICKKFSQIQLEYYSHPENAMSDETKAKISKSRIGIKISPEAKIRQINGLKTYYLENPDHAKSPGKILAREKMQKEKGKAIIVINSDGIEREFPSVNQACVILGLCCGNISHVLTGKRKHTKGYTFRFKENK